MLFELTDEQQQRLHEAEDFWLATVRPVPGAHLVPVWAVWVEGSFFIGTEAAAQKVKNVLEHRRAALALPDTARVLILEGEARLLEGEALPAVMARFQEKYDWTFDPQGGKWVLVEMVPDKILTWETNAS